MSKLPVMTASVLAAGYFAMAPMSAYAIECSELEFTGDVLNRFPNANEYCIEVAERDGKPYAHFIAEIDRVRGSKVFVKFKKPDGEYGPAVSFEPPADFRAQIGGRSYSVRSLSRGQDLDVWVPEDDWEMAQHESAEDLVAAAEVTTFAIAEADEDDYAAAATLPRTASLWPMLGMIGGALVGLGGLLGIFRRRA